LPVQATVLCTRKVIINSVRRRGKRRPIELSDRERRDVANLACWYAKDDGFCFCSQKIAASSDGYAFAPKDAHVRASFSLVATLANLPAKTPLWATRRDTARPPGIGSGLPSSAAISPPER
jgi:hypothetical protein